MVLQKKQIIDKALELLDRDGLEHLTTRKLADALNVQPGALYWHFKNKQAVLSAMAEEILKDVGVEGSNQPASQWDELLKNEMATLRQALLTYRDGTAVIIATDPSSIGAYDRLRKQLIECLNRAGFTPTQAVTIGGGALIYTIGLTLMERSPINSGNKRNEGAASPDMQTFFEEGLRLFISGAKQNLTTHRSSTNR